jgi:uncharacterized protein YdhG (YjbR/CyaY superfamily)
MEKKDTAPATIDAYIDRFSPEIQEILQRIRAIVHEVAPEAKEKISYQMPTFYLNGNLVHFAAFQRHIGLYPTPSGIEAFDKELAPFKRAKGSVQFPLDQPIPYELIRRIVEHRVAESQKK